MVMELLEGQSLHEIVKRAPLVPSDFNDVAEQSLEALIAAHQANLLHRDITPGNLMLTWLPSGRMQLKLLDFGLAKFTGKPALQTVSQTGSVLGSIYFMAPEQFERTALDVRSDLYSLGCVLHYALTGDYPFRGESATEVMASHIRGDCADLQPLRPDVPPHVCRWVMRMLARNMDDRPSSAREALAEFEKAKLDPAPVPSLPRLNPAVDVKSASRGVGTGPAPVGGALSHTTSQVPTHTTATQPVQARSTSVPPWIFAIGGVLVLGIVALGVAMAMRDDPGGTVSPRVETPVPDPAPPPADPQNGAKTGPAPAPSQRGQPPTSRWNASQDFKKKDLNGDFKLSAEEFVVSRKEPWRTNLVRRFNQLDRNGDGFLNLAEFKHWKKPAQDNQGKK